MNRQAILQELKQSDSVLASALDSIFDGLYIVDPERRIIFWNRAAEEIAGHRAEDVLGRCCHDAILNHIDDNGTLLCFSAGQRPRGARGAGQSRSSDRHSKRTRNERQETTCVP